MKKLTGIIFLSSFVMMSAFAASSAPSSTSSTPAKPASTIEATVKAQPLDDSDINRFSNAISEIKDYYVQAISDKKLLEDAIRGMLNGLDPHSEYLDEDSYKTLLMTTNGEFGGLGIEVTGEFGVLKVISPIDDTPASKAGIKSGDYIVAINGKLVSEMNLNEAIDNMRGKKGSDVTLTVIRKGEKSPLTFKLVRDTIHIASVKSNMMGNGYGYVRISQFQQPTTELLISAIENLKKQNGGNLKGLILDLRNNPGGLLETAVQVADVFLDKKSLGDNLYRHIVVYTEGRLPKAQYSAKATPGDILDGAPMVVLINEGSASASEIVAGALQDYHRAIIVGTTSFGKGSVQTVLPLDDKHAIKLTTALYHTPSGRVIQNIGIIPDIMITNLKIAKKSDETNDMLQPIKEYELKGHLAGKGDTKNIIKEDPNTELRLAQDDFQLYEAYKILRTQSMLSSRDAAKSAKTPDVKPAVTAAQN